MDMPHAATAVLLIEDNPRDAQVIQEALADTHNGAFRLEWVKSLSQGLDRLTRPGVDLIITDLDLPDSKGLDTVGSVCTHAKGLPVVVMTSTDNEAFAVQTLHRGAQDYLVKGYIQVYPHLIIRAIRYAIERHLIQTREQELLEAVERAAVAERKRAAELDRAYQELKQTQAMLVQAEKMSAVGQLAGGIAHEVKNPLNIILQCVNYLEPELARAPQQAEILQVVREAVMTADKIVRGLLDFSKPAPLELKAMPLSAVIDASLALVQSQLASKKIRLAKELAPILPHTLLDENQMKQVFINLFLNAFQAMPDGGQLTIRCYSKALTERGLGIGSRTTDAFRVGDTALVCEIEDTGTGIPKGLLSRVFTPFFTTKEPGQGVGLGLAICKTIVEAHRGVIQLESEEGRGTGVTVILPLAAEH